MTERLSDVEARIGTVHQLSAVVTAMRGIAAARSREARGHLAGIRTYAQTVATAISQALSALPPSDRPDAPTGRGGAHAVVALCAEQGFAGSFNDHVLEAAGKLAQGGPRRDTELLLIGDRGLMVAAERGIDVGWSTAMIAHAGQAPALANRIAEALFERIEAGDVSRVTIVHTTPGGTGPAAIVQTQLVPFDFGRFPAASATLPPVLTLPPERLLSRLVEEYVFAEICEAVMLSFAAENEARMRAMIAARTNVATTLDDLVSRARQLRQEQITSEIIELASGTLAARAD